MNTEVRTDTSLLGALLVAEELVTQEQLDTCLMLQRQDHPDLPIGEVLVRYGYLKRQDLDGTLTLQRSIREALIARVDTQGPPLPDMRALLIGPSQAPALARLLRDHGVAADAYNRSGTGGIVHYDLVLVAPNRLEGVGAAPAPGALIGMLPATAWGEGPLGREVEAMAVRYVDQARAALANRGDLEALRHRQYELQMTEVLLRNVTSAPTPHEALVKLMLIVRDLVPIQAATLYQIDHDTSSLVFEIVLGPYRAELTKQRIPLGQGVAGWVACHGEPLIIPDVRRDERFSGAFDSKTGFQTQSMLCVPMHALGEIRGVLQLINKLDGQFDEHDMLVLRLTAAIGGMILMLAADAANGGPAWLKEVAGATRFG